MGMHCTRLHGVVRQLHCNPSQRQQIERPLRRPHIGVKVLVVRVLVVQEMHALERSKWQGEERAACGADGVVEKAQGGMRCDAAVASIVHGREGEVGDDGAKGCSPMVRQRACECGVHGA